MTEEDYLPLARLTLPPATVLIYLAATLLPPLLLQPGSIYHRLRTSSSSGTCQVFSTRLELLRYQPQELSIYQVLSLLDMRQLTTVLLSDE